MTYQNTSRNWGIDPAASLTSAACCLTLRDQTSDLLTREVLLLRDCIEVAKRQWGFEIRAAVILPSQIQVLGCFDTGLYGIGRAMADIQATFERHLPAQEAPVWDGPPALTMVGWAAAPMRIRFIEAAPVRAGLVDDPRDWRFSTAYRPEGRANDADQSEVA